MKKGIAILILITLSLILINPQKINAAITPGWASTLPNPQNIAYYSCSSDTKCTLQTNNIDYFESQQTLRPFVYNPNYWIIGQNGYAIGTPVTTMKPGYLYSIDFYLCSNENVEPNYDIYSSEFENFSNGNVLSITRRTTIDNEPVIDGGRIFAYCHVYSALIVPEEYHNWAYIRLKRQKANITNVVMSTVAVETKEMGIYTETIKNVIENSGYATAESVEQVHQSVNRVEEAITGDHEYNDTPSEEIQGKEELDNLKEKEDELIGDLDFSKAEEIEVVINPETNNLIWEMIERLRNMNGKIILFITSILSLGIIKLILNR